MRADDRRCERKRQRSRSRSRSREGRDRERRGEREWRGRTDSRSREQHGTSRQRAYARHHAGEDGPSSPSSHERGQKVHVEIHPFLLSTTMPEAKGELVPRASFATVEANKRAGAKDSLLITQSARNHLKPAARRPNPYLARERGPPMFRAPRPRSLQFVEPGKYVAEAELMRATAEMEQLRREVSNALGQVGIDTEIVTDLVGPNQSVPDCEWWDLPLVKPFSEGDHNYSLITPLIQRPALLAPPIDPNTQVDLRPLLLTTAERKKLRRQRRLAAHKERQEQIKLGLLPPEPQKVRIANIARVLGTQSIQEPSRIEAEIRTQAQARHEAHLQANVVRSLEAKEARQREAEATAASGSSSAVQMAVFRIKHLDASQWRFKVIKNAQQLELTGCALLFNAASEAAAFSLVLVEGSLTAIRRYSRLMLERIKWTEAPAPDAPPIPNNECTLVWEGSMAARNFPGFWVRGVDNQLDAREFLAAKGLESYWRLAKDLP